MTAESIKEISFTVARHDEHAVKFNKLASTVTFKLGIGPCGRFVESLESAIDYHGVTIKQVSYPEDYGHILETWQNMVSRDQATLGTVFGRAGICKGHRVIKGAGFGNLEYMTPTQEEFEEAKAETRQWRDKVYSLAEQREIKEFFYKLEDVRGRIVVIR